MRFGPSQTVCGRREPSRVAAPSFRCRPAKRLGRAGPFAASRIVPLCSAEQFRRILARELACLVSPRPFRRGFEPHLNRSSSTSRIPDSNSFGHPIRTSYSNLPRFSLVLPVTYGKRGRFEPQFSRVQPYPPFHCPSACCTFHALPSHFPLPVSPAAYSVSYVSVVSLPRSIMTPISSREQPDVL